MKAFFRIIDMVNEKLGSIVCFLILLIMLAIGTSTISRYFFNEPMTIVWPFTRQIFGIFVLVGAAYTLLYDKHIRVEIFYDFFPAWLKGVSRAVSLLCFLAFLGALTWQGVVMAKISLMLKEVSTHWSRIPIYPFKILLPIVTFLFLLQGIAFFLGAKKPSNEKKSGDRSVSDVSE